MDSRSLLLRARRTMILKRHRPKPLSFEVKRVWRSLVLTLVFIILISSLFFFFSTNSRAQKGYFMRQMELQNAELQSRNEALKQGVLEAQSYKNITKDQTVRRMTPADSLLYIPIQQERVSRKN